MDPLNIIAAVNFVASFGANSKGAKKGLRTSITSYREKPKTYLQKLPLVLAILTLVATVFGFFQIGTFQYNQGNENVRIAGLVFYIIFSWFQIWSYKSLGESHAQDILFMHKHKLVTAGPYKIIRHPQYLSQILMDIGAGFVTMSYVVFALTIIEIPFVILRAVAEEKLFLKHMQQDYKDYQKKSGFMLPFVG